MNSADVDALFFFAHRLRPVKVRGGLLPRLWFFTDRHRVPDPLAVVDQLPRHSGVVLRDYDAPDRADLAIRLAAAAKKHGLIFLVGADAELAHAVGAAGVHFPERSLGQLCDIRARLKGALLTVSVHTPEALARAEKAGADACFAAPVFATASHPGAPFLGLEGLAGIVAKSRLPVIALGGIDGATVRELEGVPLAGIAAIGGLAGQAFSSRSSHDV